MWLLRPNDLLARSSPGTLVAILASPLPQLQLGLLISCKQLGASFQVLDRVVGSLPRHLGGPPGGMQGLATIWLLPHIH